MGELTLSELSFCSCCDDSNILEEREDEMFSGATLLVGNVGELSLKELLDPIIELPLVDEIREADERMDGESNDDSILLDNSELS